MQLGMDGNNNCILSWDTTNTGGGTMTYFGFKHANSWQVYLNYASTSWINSSDQRLKNILAPIEDATTKLGRISPVYYEYKADESKKRRIGLIAQEVQRDFPETIDIGPGEQKLLGVAYADLVPVLLQAINELSVRVEALEAKKPKKK